jgi:hypothetical protein
MNTKFFIFFTFSGNDIAEIVLLLGKVILRPALSMSNFRYDILIAYPAFSAPA